MNILMTGATGYAGHHAARALGAAGHRVTALVRDEGSARARALVREEVGLVRGDVRRPETYAAALRGCDAVVHAMIDASDPRGADECLFGALREAARAEPRPRAFVYTTGCSIYGERPERWLDETTPANPASPLSFRMEMERRALALEGYRTVVLRPGFFYGKDGLTSMTARWFAEGEAGRAVFYGKPDKGWSWVHVDDLADAYRRAVEARSVAGEIFCVADAQRPKVLEVQTACARAAGHHGPVEMRPATAEFWQSLAFDQDEFIRSDKIARLLGWSPRHGGVLDEPGVHYAAWKAAAGGAS